MVIANQPWSLVTAAVYHADALAPQAASTTTPTEQTVSSRHSSQSKDQNTVDLNDPAVIDMIKRLETRDAEVRAHEQAHMAAGGQYVTSGASYTYQSGPDGKRYAVGGEVGIDVSPIANDPEATLAKAQQIIQAATAPAEPSSQDYAVARSAQSMATQARQELAEASSSAQTKNQSENEDTQASDTKTESLAKNLTSAQVATEHSQQAQALYVQTQGFNEQNAVGTYQANAHRLGVHIAV